MRIRRCASRLLGSAYCPAPHGPAPRFEGELPLPPPPHARPTPAATVFCAGSGGSAAATASSEICELSRSPWDLISELDLSDPQAEKKIEESYSVHVTSRASWLFQTSVPATSLKEEELADENSAQPRHELAPKKTVVKKKSKKKEKEEEEEEEDEEKEEDEESKPKKKAKVKKEKSDGNAAEVAQVWACKKRDGKRWFCRRQVNQPNSFCEYHLDQYRTYYSCTSTSAPVSASLAASKLSTSSKICRKKAADTSEGFYYYAGFGPFRTKRHCRNNNTQEPSLAYQEEAPPGDSMHESARAEQEEEAPPEDSMHKSAPSEKENQALPEDSIRESAPTEQEEEAQPEHHAAPTGGQAQADDTDNDQAATHHDKSNCDEIAGIAGSDEESSSDDMYGCNGNLKPRVVGVNGDSKRKSGWKKRWRKPVKARSLKSLM